MSMTITTRIARELLAHEGLVREAYKDSRGIWTWGVGVTNASGHTVYPAYKDNPQTLRRCLEVYVELLERRYAAGVRTAFAGHALTEAQFGAALSFHYNTGGIGKAAWVRSWKAGHVAQAEREILNWRKPPEIIPRREKEQALFFRGTWSGNGRMVEYPVRKPSYTPNYGAGTTIAVDDILKELLGG